MHIPLLFFCNTASTEIYTLSLHDALPIFPLAPREVQRQRLRVQELAAGVERVCIDRKSTRLNSSHRCISYAVFCLKKKIIRIFISRYLVCAGIMPVRTYYSPLLD